MADTVDCHACGHPATIRFRVMAEHQDGAGQVCRATGGPPMLPVRTDIDVPMWVRLRGVRTVLLPDMPEIRGASP